MLTVFVCFTDRPAHPKLAKEETQMRALPSFSFFPSSPLLGVRQTFGYALTEGEEGESVGKGETTD